MSNREILEVQKNIEEQEAIESNYRIIQASVAGACALASFLFFINGDLRAAAGFAVAGTATYIAFERFQPFPPRTR